MGLIQNFIWKSNELLMSKNYIRYNSMLWLFKTRGEKQQIIKFEKLSSENILHLNWIMAITAD